MAEIFEWMKCMNTLFLNLTGSSLPTEGPSMVLGPSLGFLSRYLFLKQKMEHVSS